jgi:CRP/FNR family transcriptional regulator
MIEMEQAIAPGGTGAPATLVALPELAARLGVDLPADRVLAATTFAVRRLRPSDALYRAGDPFESLYLVHAGVFKTVLVDSGGAEQVLAFPMAGDVVGIDGVDPGRYPSECIALEQSAVAVIPFARLAHLGRDHSAVEHLVYRIFSRELVCKHEMMLRLGTLHAEARVAAFLLELADRHKHIGLSRQVFVLRMTRAELGSYLGVKLETVSRALSSFAAAGLIEVSRRTITIRDAAGLHQIVETGRSGAPGTAAHPLLHLVHPGRAGAPQTA